MATTEIRFPTHNDQRRAGACFVWYGDAELLDWPIMLSVAPMVSDSLTRSNWRVILADMDRRFPSVKGCPEWDGAAYSGGDWYVADLSAGSGMTSTAHILARPDTEVYAALVEWADRLDDYAIASEDDLSDLECEEAPICPTCGASHVKYSGEYDYERDRQLCDLCQRRSNRADRLARKYRGFTTHQPYRRFIARVRAS